MSNKFKKIDEHHKDIFEADPLVEFLSKEILIDENEELPEYISTTRPEDYEGASERIRVSLYSPLDMHFYDSERRHTGPTTTTFDGVEVPILEENIPGSSYWVLGERKYVSLPPGEEIRLELDGYDEGSFALILESGEERKVFSHLPVSEDTTGSLTITPDGIENVEVLTMDYNGDDTGGKYTAQVGGGYEEVEDTESDESIEPLPDSSESPQPASPPSSEPSSSSESLTDTSEASPTSDESSSTSPTSNESSSTIFHFERILISLRHFE